VGVLVDDVPGARGRECASSHAVTFEDLRHDAHLLDVLLGAVLEPANPVFEGVALARAREARRDFQVRVEPAEAFADDGLVAAGESIAAQQIACGVNDAQKTLGALVFREYHKSDVHGVTCIGAQ